MKAVVVYESMYGNTHAIADSIADGLRGTGAVEVVSVADARPENFENADLVVVGGPTHAHGMSRASTRKAAIDAARKPNSELLIDLDAMGPGLRDWLGSIGGLPESAAAFDTRIDAPPAITGRASKGIAKRLRRHGCKMIAAPESYLVTKKNELLADEEKRAHEWGAELASIAWSGR